MPGYRTVGNWISKAMNFPYGQPSEEQFCAALVSGSVTVWQPAAGNLFRIMGLEITISAGSTDALAGDNLLQIIDYNVNSQYNRIIFQSYIYLPTSATQEGDIKVFSREYMIGIRSRLPNNPLIAKIATPLTDGHINITVNGFEEG